MVTKAALAALVAFAVAAVLTPLAARFARRIGAVDDVKERGLAREATPLLGGLAIFGGALVAGLIFLPDNQRTEGILAGAALITIVGALDDVFDLHLAGQARRAARGGRRARDVRRDGGRVHAAVRAPRRARRPRRPGDRARARGADERRELLRRRRRAGRRRVRDLGGGVLDHRVRSRPQHGRHPGRDHGRRRARLPAVQLPPGVGVHGRLRVEPARAVARAR